MYDETIYEPSPIICQYKEHVLLVTRIAERFKDEANNEKSILIRIDNYRYELLKQILNDSQMAFELPVVLVEHKEQNWLEFSQLPKGSKVESFYRLFRLLANNVGNSDNVEENEIEFKETVKDYLESELSKAMSYCRLANKTKPDNVITYTYLHRKLARKKSIRNSVNGSTKEIQRLIDLAVEKGYLIELAKDVSYKKYESGGRMFKIIVPALNN